MIEEILLINGATSEQWTNILIVLSPMIIILVILITTYIYDKITINNKHKGGE